MYQAKSPTQAPRVMHHHAATVSASDFPLIEMEELKAVAIIEGIDGASYRPLGAAMFLDSSGAAIGSLSSGCIDGDIVLQMRSVASEDRGRRVRYGEGSPYIDLRLPCGGGLDILILPISHINNQTDLRCSLMQRIPLTLDVSIDGVRHGETGTVGGGFHLAIHPDPKFIVIGAGPEPRIFASMVHAMNYDVELLSHDPETLADLASFPASVRLVTDWRNVPEDLSVDAYTACVLFFHDHDREPQILAHLLSSPAFYVGAQGSRAVARRRREALSAFNLSTDQIDRLHGPIGLIPSVKDPRRLAVSVLAEILNEIPSFAAGSSKHGPSPAQNGEDYAR